MKKFVYCALIVLMFCAQTFAQKNVAVLEIERRGAALAEISREEAMEITGVIRSAAVRTLPRGQFSVMTSETVQAMGGAVLAECVDESCVIALGRTIDAEYIVRGVLSKFQTMFTLNIEMFETEFGNLVATSAPVRSDDLMGLLDRSGEVSLEMFRDFVERSAPQPAPQPSVIAEPQPIPQLPTTYTLTTRSIPADISTIEREPDLPHYDPGTEVSVSVALVDGYRFAGWFRGYNFLAFTKDSSVTVTMERDLTLTAKFKREPARGTRFGVRGAYNYSVANIKVYDNRGHSNRTNGGSGAELGFVTSTYLSDFWSLRSGLNLIFRVPVSRGDNYYENYNYRLTELGIAVPAFLRVGGRSMFVSAYWETGVQFDFAIPDDFDNRNALDVGVGIGCGFTIGRHIEVGHRFIVGMRDFVDVPAQPDYINRNRLFQYNVGLTYMIGGK